MVCECRRCKVQAAWLSFWHVVADYSEMLRRIGSNEEFCCRRRARKAEHGGCDLTSGETKVRGKGAGIRQNISRLVLRPRPRSWGT
jgi:hypothetical protein